MFFFNFLTDLFGAKGAILHVETFKFQEVFLSKPKLILIGNHMLEAAASNTHDLLCRSICVPSTLLNRPIWSK
jgi:hypothetical protein